MIEKDLVAYDEKKLLNKQFAKIINDSGKLVGQMKEIVNQYHLLSPSDKQVVTNALVNNNKIESLCKNSIGFTPIKYNQISNNKFRVLLKDFLTSLWEEYYFVNSIKDNFGTVQEHFKFFKENQNAKVCPFCGLYPLKPAKSIYRNDYDHYLPKAMYPFVSINYQNLYPICDECNCDEKKTTDTLYRGNIRREVFFPFDKAYKPEELLVSIKVNSKYDKQTLKTLLDEIDWEFAIELAGKNDPRLISWDEVFHIKRRYREYLIDFQKTWFQDFVLKRYKEDMADGLSFNRYKVKLISDSKDQIKDNPLSILRYVYFNFIFSITDIELRLKEVI